MQFVSQKTDIILLKVGLKSSKFTCWACQSPYAHSFIELYDLPLRRLTQLCQRTLHLRSLFVVISMYTIYDRLESTKTDSQGEAAESFPVSNDFTNINHELTFFSSVSGIRHNPLDLFLTTHPQYHNNISFRLLRLQ